MTEQITDVRIRDNHPSVPVQKATTDSKRVGKKHPDKILFRVNGQVGWWNLDDLSRAVLDSEFVVTYRGWCLIAKENAPRLVAAFDAVGELHRLEFLAVTDD